MKYGVKEMLLLCSLNGETYAFGVNTGDTLLEIVGRICVKWPTLSEATAIIWYKLPSCNRCKLCNDNDVRDMLRAAKTFNVESTPVSVTSIWEVGSGSVGSALYLEASDVEIPQPVEEQEGAATFVGSRNSVVTMNLGWDKIVLNNDSVFEGGAPEFRVCLQKISLQTGFQYKLVRNDSNRVKAICATHGNTKCPWMVLARKHSGNGFFYVRDLCNVHTCGSDGHSFGIGRMSSDLVADVIHDAVREKATMSPCEAQQLLKNFRFKVSYDVARAGLEKSRSKVFGDMKQSFNSLPLYIEQVLEANLGSVIALEVDEETRRFKRLFFALDGCIQGFDSCRPLLFLDGAHLKGQFQGHILSATGEDGNDGIFPLCFAIVDAENADNWEWFLTHVRDVVDQGRRLNFISDRNRGLVDSVAAVFPTAFHAFCLYHLKLNLRSRLFRRSIGKFIRDRMVSLLADCGYAPTVEAYERKMREMICQGGAPVKEFFDTLAPENWSNAFFPGQRYGHMCSSVAESFNAWILKERYLPVAQMVDAIRRKLMTLHFDRSQKCKSWDAMVCPKIDLKLSDAMKEAKYWNVLPATQFEHEVQSSPPTIVNLFHRTCTCQRWQSVCYPCPHAVAAIMKIESAMYHYTDRYYWRGKYAETYGNAIHPVALNVQASLLHVPPTVLPPYSRRPPGRPHTKRIPSRGESTRPLKCSRCGVRSNHNRRTCAATTQL